MEKSIAEQLAEVQLETAKLQLEDQREKNAQATASRADKARKNKARQTQLRAEVTTRADIASRCNHRQGGTPKNPLKGKGPTALNIVNLPDGFTKLVMCSVCRLRNFTPHPRNASAKARKGESAADAKNRAELYAEQLAAHEKLIEMAGDNLTDDGAQVMDCGTTIVLRDEDGREVIPTRPCDTYATV